VFIPETRDSMENTLSKIKSFLDYNTYDIMVVRGRNTGAYINCELE
jgi:hypothetical protein